MPFGHERPKPVQASIQMGEGQDDANDVRLSKPHLAGNQLLQVMHQLSSAELHCRHRTLQTGNLSFPEFERDMSGRGVLPPYRPGRRRYARARFPAKDLAATGTLAAGPTYRA